MRHFGIQLTEGSNVENLTVASGTAFPSNPNEGELFFRSDTAVTDKGLYLYVGGNWDRIASTDSLTMPTGASLPATANEGDAFYRNSNDANEGLYVYNGSSWVSISAGTGGTVTSISVVTANGVSGSVATATTTPAITLTLGDITPSSVAAVGTVTGSNLSGTNTGDQTITLTSDVTGSGTASFATTISNNVVTNAKLATIASARIKGRVTASTGNVEDLTGTQATTLLDTFTTSLKGLAPGSGGGTANYLRADGTWATPPGTGVSTFSAGTTGFTPSTATSGAVTLSGILIGANGGTGVDNTGKTITLGGNLTTVGAFATTLTVTGTTSVTLPTSGTLATTGSLGQFGPTTSAEVASLITDETGTGLLVFNTSPAFVTSVTTASTTFSAFNTGATTLNIGGAATTLNLGASTGNTTIANALTVTGAITTSSSIVQGVSTSVSASPTAGTTGTVDSFAAATFRSAFYALQITQSTTYEVLQLHVVHNGSGVFVTEFGRVSTTTPTGVVFDASISTGTVSVTWSGGAAGTTIKSSVTRITV